MTRAQTKVQAFGGTEAHAGGYNGCRDSVSAQTAARVAGAQSGPMQGGRQRHGAHAQVNPGRDALRGKGRKQPAEGVCYGGHT